jgi:transposase
LTTQFINVDRDTPYLFPPSVQDYLPENHLARFVVDIVEQLDVTHLSSVYSGKGSRPYHPSMMLALLFYGYASGTFSSRKLEQSTYDSIAYRYLCANTHPDHDSINAFRKRFLTELKGLFVDILVLAKTMGTLKLGTISLDGTKIRPMPANTKH